MRKIWFCVVVGLLALPGAGPRVLAAKNPAKASVRCRSTIGKSVQKLVGSGLKIMQRCHTQRLKGRASGDCNSLAGQDFGRAKQQAIARINVACKAGDPVAANYGAATVGVGITKYLDAIQSALEEDGVELLAAPEFVGDPATVKPLRKCHDAVGAGRTGIVQAALKGAVKCQQRIDKSAQSFGPIDPSCLGGAGGAASKASQKVGKACGSLSGADVGSCPSLPGCLVSAGEAAAQLVARLTYGGPSQCGDGIEDPSEACDDGNTIEDDGCTAACRLPECGDLVVNDPSEECDEPNGPGGDDPGENCYRCKRNVCGDGFVDRQEPGIEECDDGNDVANDGCTDCKIDPVSCDANGVEVRLAIDYPRDLVGAASGVVLDLSYPAYLSIPGSGTASSVRARVTSALPEELSFLGRDDDTNGDGVDDRVRATATAPIGRSVSPGDLANVQFDCAQGTPVLPADLPCTVAEIDGPDGIPVDDALRNQAHCVLTIVGAGPPPTSTTTGAITTTSSPVSTTTTTTPPLCGNHVVDPGEECDDGNTNPNDGCTNFCTICGNGVVTAPESCDDGNTDVDDNCPEDCRIEPCLPTANVVQTMTVTASRPDLTSIRFLLDYPDGRVALPGGAGPDSPFGTFMDGAGDVTSFDLEHAVRVVVSATFTFDTTTIVRVGFLGCGGQPAPSASDYRCLVIDASDGSFSNVDGVTCAVSIP